MARKEQRIQEAVIDEQNKEGPPFILEMAQNEKAIEEKFTFELLQDFVIGLFSSV